MNNRSSGKSVDAIPITDRPDEFKDSRPERHGRDGKKSGTSFRRRGKRRRSKGKSFVLVLFFLLPLLLGSLYLALSAFVIPYYLKNIMPADLSRNFGFPVSVGTASFDPFTLTLSLQDGLAGTSAVGGTQAATPPLFSFSELIADFSVRSLTRGILITEHLQITKPFLHIYREPDGSYQIERIFRPLIDPEGGRGKNESEKNPWSFFLSAVIHNLSVTDGTIVLKDGVTGAAHAINEFSLTLPFVSLLGEGKPEKDLISSFTKPLLSAKVNGSPFHLMGETVFTEKGQRWKIDLNLDNLHLPTYLLNVPSMPEVSVAAGVADIDATVIFTNEYEASWQIGGSARMTGVRLGEKGREKIMLPLVNIDFPSQPLSKNVTIREIRIDKPDIPMERTANGLWFIPGLTTGGGKTPEPSTAEEGKMASLPVFFTRFIPERITMTDATVTVMDSLRAGKAPVVWTGVSLTLEKNAPSEARPSFSYRVTYQGEGRFAAQGTMIFNPFVVEKGTLELENFGLKEMLPSLHAGVDAEIVSSGRVLRSLAQFAFERGNGGLALSLKNVRMDLEDLLLNATDRETLRIPQMTLQGGHISSGERRMELGTVEASGAVLSVSAGEARPSAWLRFFPAQDPPGGQNGTGDWIIQAQSINATNIALHLTVLSREKQWIQEFTELQIQIDNFVNDSHAKIPFTCTGKLAGGNLSLDGSILFSPFSVQANASATELPLGMFAQLYEKWLDQGTVQGKISATGVIELPRLAFQGDMSVAGFALSGNEKEIISWREAKAGGAILRESPLVFHAEEFVIEGPRGKVEISEDGKAGLVGITRKRTKGEEEEEGPSFRIDYVQLEEGGFIVRDHNATPPFQLELSGVSGEMIDFANEAGSQFEVQLNGTDNSGASIDFSGIFGFFDESPFMEHETTIIGWRLDVLAPYLQPILGYDIKGGIVTSRINYREKEGHVIGKAIFSVRDFIVGARIEEKSPLPLALALLTDKERIITLEVPMRGDSDNPGSSYRKALLNHVKWLLLKSAVSPFSVLASSGLFPLSQSPEIISFEYGSSSLSAVGQEDLKNFAHALSERPWLRLTVRGFADMARDGAALLAAEEKKKNKERLEREKELTKTLSSQYGKEIIPKGKTPASGEAVSQKQEQRTKFVKKDEVLKLASERAKSVHHFLVEMKVRPEQIALSSQAGYVEGTDIGRPGNRVVLGAESIIPLDGSGIQ